MVEPYLEAARYRACASRLEAARSRACASRLEAARYRACASRLEAARYRACASRLEAARYRACASRRACVPYGCGLSALRFARSRSPHHGLDEVAEAASKAPLVVVPGVYFHP